MNIIINNNNNDVQRLASPQRQTPTSQVIHESTIAVSDAANQKGGADGDDDISSGSNKRGAAVKAEIDGEANGGDGAAVAKGKGKGKGKGKEKEKEAIVKEGNKDRTLVVPTLRYNIRVCVLVAAVLACGWGRREGALCFKGLRGTTNRRWERMDLFA